MTQLQLLFKCPTQMQSTLLSKIRTLHQLNIAVPGRFCNGHQHFHRKEADISPMPFFAQQVGHPVVIRQTAKVR